MAVRTLRGLKAKVLLGLVFLYAALSVIMSNKQQRAAQLPGPLVSLEELLLDDLSGNSGFNLERSPTIVHAELMTDALPPEQAISTCNRGRALLGSAPNATCAQLQCLLIGGADASVPISAWQAPLRLMVDGPAAAAGAQCLPPGRGQLPLPAGVAPAVSFVMVAFNDAEAAAQALLEVFRTASEAPSAEYIIIDDGSDQPLTPLLQTAERLTLLFNISVMLQRNQASIGYWPCVSQAAGLARGKHVALVGTETLVLKGWLTSLLLTLRESPRAGIVSALVLSRGEEEPESSGIILANGDPAYLPQSSTMAYEHQYGRRVDFVAASALLARRELLAGAASTEYDLGIFQLMELGMATWQAGFEVLLQPTAIAVTTGSNFPSSSWVDRQILARNKKAFNVKWGSVLQAKHCPQQSPLHHMVTRHYSPRVLWIDDIVPEPDHDSGSIRAVNILRILLARGAHVTFVPMTGGREFKYTLQLRQLGVQTFPVLPSEQWVFTAQGKCLFDVIVVSRRAVYSYAQWAIADQCPGIPVVYDTVDLHFIRETRSAMSEAQQARGANWDFQSLAASTLLNVLENPAPQLDDLRRKRNRDLYFIDKSAVTLVVSPLEEEVIKYYRPRANVVVLSNVHDTSAARSRQVAPCEGRSGTLFVGNMNHGPNQQAIVLLITNILPALLRVLPPRAARAFKLHVVGANIVPALLSQLMKEHEDKVVFHGQLDDQQLEQLYSQVRVVAAPLLSGAGVKGKVNQAMLMGVPVVATPVAIEGMHGQDRQDFMLGETPEGFARALAEVYSDCQLWRRLSLGGLKSLQRHFSMEAAEPIVKQVLEGLGFGEPAAAEKGKCRAPGWLPHAQQAQQGASPGTAGGEGSEDPFAAAQWH